jgi:hypothetical protein
MHDSIHLDAESKPAVSHIQTPAWNRRISQHMYANILFLSRAAKLRKWKRHSRSSSLPNLPTIEKASAKTSEPAKSVEPVKGPEPPADEISRGSNRIPIPANLPRHIQREMRSSSAWQHPPSDVLKPTILVSSYESEVFGESSRPGDWSKGWKDVGGIPWVDWVEEYRKVKDAEVQRRKSMEIASTSLNPGTDADSSNPRASFTENDLDTFMDEPDDNASSEKSDENILDRMLIPWWSSIKNNVQQTLHRQWPSGALAVYPPASPTMAAHDKFPSMTQRRMSNLASQDDSDAKAKHRYQLSLDLDDIRNIFSAHLTSAAVAEKSTAPPKTQDQPTSDSPSNSSSPINLPQRQSQSPVVNPTLQSSGPSSVSLQRMFSYTPGLAPFSYGSAASPHSYNAGISPSLSSQGYSKDDDPKGQSSLTAFFGMGGSGLSTPEEYAGSGPKLDGENTASPTTIRIRHTIKSRLEYAKKVCDAELRLIIDGLNEYVERGLQYVEDVDEVLEHGVASPDSDELEEEEHMDSSHNEDSPSQPDVHNFSTDHVVPPSPMGGSTATSPSTVRKRSLQISLQGIDEGEEAFLGSERSDDDSGSDQEQLKELTEQLKQELHGSNYQDEMPNLQSPQTSMPNMGTLTPSDSMPNHLSHVNSRLTLISEDSYLPTPFILTLQDLISLAQSVLDTPLDTFLENSGTCAELVSRIQELGAKWDENPRWPCREWYVRLLLGVAALNRVVEWWEAERGFWANSFTLTPSDTQAKSTQNEDGSESGFENERAPDYRRRSSGASSTWSSNYMLPPARNSGTIIEEESETEPDEYEEQRTHATATPLSSGSETIMMNKRHSEQIDSTDSRSEFNDQKNDSDQLQLDAQRGQNNTIVMELSLSTVEVRYLSPVWQLVVG